MIAKVCGPSASAGRVMVPDDDEHVDPDIVETCEPSTMMAQSSRPLSDGASKAITEVHWISGVEFVNSVLLTRGLLFTGGWFGSYIIWSERE